MSGDDHYQQAYAKAVRLLAQREHGRDELADKIRRRHDIDDASMQGLLDDLEQSGYLDDQRYAEMFVRSSVARGQGPLKIAYALRNKGVDDELTDHAVAVVAVDWLAQARLQREKKFGEEIPEDFKERARQSRFLAGRGFYGDTINAVFR